MPRLRENSLNGARSHQVVRASIALVFVALLVAWRTMSNRGTAPPGTAFEVNGELVSTAERDARETSLLEWSPEPDKACESAQALIIEEIVVGQEADRLSIVVSEDDITAYFAAEAAALG